MTKFALRKELMFHNQIDYCEARAFSVGAHNAVGQVRKYTGEPYWKHTVAVSQKLFHLDDLSLAMAGLLHDVLEDTKVTYDQLLSEFGHDVAELVYQVTDVAKPEDGNRAERVRINREHLARASPRAKSLKLADLIDNTASIVAHDPKFAKVYLEEKRLLMPFLSEGCSILYRQAMEQVG